MQRNIPDRSIEALCQSSAARDEVFADLKSVAKTAKVGKRVPRGGLGLRL